jgi:2-amino-4-hydroxy-6-hydroxymethyldihydropteridine diphosphokinase
MAQVFVGLGSNLSDPVKQVNRALCSLDELAQTRVLSCSKLYGSAPQGPQDQPDFVNAVCLLETQLSPMNLLQALQGIEQAQGRIKKRHWGERLIDLDILLFDDLTVSLPELTIPHIEIVNRDFVLMPLFEIAPDVNIPNQGSVWSLMSQLKTSYLHPIKDLCMKGCTDKKG